MYRNKLFPAGSAFLSAILPKIRGNILIHSNLVPVYRKFSVISSSSLLRHHSEHSHWTCQENTIASIVFVPVVRPGACAQVANSIYNNQPRNGLSSGSHYEKWTDLSCEDLAALLESHDIQLFDVREPKEIATTGKIPGSVNIPLGDVKEALQLADVDFYKRFKVSKPQKHDTNIVFYGLGPIKSSAALELAHKFDYKKARHYSGGYEEWCKLNKTAEKKAS